MGQLACPLCGRFVSLTHFDPTTFIDDVYVVEVTGLGRGKGVTVTGTHSILQPEDTTIKLIKDRLLNISKILLDNQCLDPREVLSKLRIQTISPTELTKRDKVIENLSEEAEKLNSRILDLSEKNVNLTSSTIYNLRKTIAEQDALLEDLAEQNVGLNAEKKDLEEKLNHRTEQAKKLFRIAKNQTSKIEKLEDEIEDLSEENING